jgi:hypothetical protein
MALSDTYLAGEHRKLPAMLSPSLATGIWRGADVLREFLACRISPVMSSIVFRTDVLRTIGGLPSGWPNAADLACWLPLLVANNVGFINEQCSTFCVHPEAESSKFTAATRVAELRQLVDVVGNAVDGKIEDAREQRDLHLEARRYFARNAIGVIAAQYKRGMPLSATLALLWQWRRDLVHVGLRNVPDLARPIAIILLPRLVTNAVSRALSFARHVRCMLARGARRTSATQLKITVSGQECGLLVQRAASADGSVPAVLDQPRPVSGGSEIRLGLPSARRRPIAARRPGRPLAVRQLAVAAEAIEWRAERADHVSREHRCRPSGMPRRLGSRA